MTDTKSFRNHFTKESPFKCLAGCWHVVQDWQHSESLGEAGQGLKALHVGWRSWHEPGVGDKTQAHCVHRCTSVGGAGLPIARTHREICRSCPLACRQPDSQTGGCRWSHGRTKHILSGTIFICTRSPCFCAATSVRRMTRTARVYGCS